jgi:hypothetical protein
MSQAEIRSRLNFMSYQHMSEHLKTKKSIIFLLDFYIPVASSLSEFI